MAKPHHTCFTVADRSYLAIIKKDIHQLAQQIDFSPQRLGEIDIIVAELTSNLVKYGVDGQLLVKIVAEPHRTGIELLSIDQGPGMSDISRMMEDGISTSNTLGHGLGAIKRLSDDFEVYTVRGWGTILLSRVWLPKTETLHKRITTEIKSVLIPKPGETACGDAMGIKRNSGNMMLLLGDGLGHGVEAAKVADTAVKAFHESNETDPVEMIRHIHQAVRKTRGLVATVANFDYTSKNWQVCGVGNIACRIGNIQQTKVCLPYNGIIGMNIPTSMNNQVMAYLPEQMIILCSDGLKSRLELYKSPAIYKYDGSILAAALYKDYGRQTDDMSVVVGKINLT